MDALRTPPTPIFDNLERLDNPFQCKHFSVAEFFAETSVHGAQIDYEYALKFLYSYNGSTATFSAYRREVERLLQWSWRVRGKSICNIKREDIEEFIAFCHKPPQAWIGTKNVARFTEKDGSRVINSQWRPFVASVSKVEHRAGVEPTKKLFELSASATNAMFAILSSFYNYLIEVRVIDANPIASIRQKSKFLKKQQHRAPVRRVSNLQWDYVIETAEKMANENPGSHERTLFIMNCLYAMYLRISELVADERSTPVMGDFRKDMDGNWWFHVTGKGNKSRIVTVSIAMLKALKRYRKYLGLSALPSPEEKIPLVSKVLGRGSVTSTRKVRYIVQQCFDVAFDRMRKDGLEEDAAELKTATVHWLRHTGISEDVKIRPREHVRDDAGHSSMQTTDRYIESELRERHASGKHKPIKEFDAN